MKKYQFDTGVRPFDHDPPAVMAFIEGYEDSGNGVYVIPFFCEEVPKRFKPYQADNVFKEDTETTCCREIITSTGLKSKYAHFKLESDVGNRKNY